MFDEPYEHLGAKRRGINSVEQGIAVLQAVVNLKKAATLKEIADRAGMQSSQTHRYVSSLVNCGMLRQDGVTGRYDLGPTALRTGIAAMSRNDALTRAEEAACDFSKSSGVTTLVSVWGSNGPTIIRWNPGMPPVYTMLTIGSVLSLTASSTGRVFMAFLPEPHLSPLLSAEGFKTPLSKNPDLVKDREHIRSTFMCDIDSRLVPGLRVIAAPILTVGGHLVAVVTGFIPEAVPREKDEGYRRDLLSMCAKATSDLGGNWLGPRT